MEMTEVQSRVKKVIGAVLKVDSANIGDSDHFVFDLGADSMQSVQLVGGFEEEFDIEMDEDKALGVDSVDGAVEFIAGYLD